MALDSGNAENRVVRHQSVAWSRPVLETYPASSGPNLPPSLNGIGGHRGRAAALESGRSRREIPGWRSIGSDGASAYTARTRRVTSITSRLAVASQARLNHASSAVCKGVNWTVTPSSDEGSSADGGAEAPSSLRRGVLVTPRPPARSPASLTLSEREREREGGGFSRAVRVRGPSRSLFLGPSFSLSSARSSWRSGASDLRRPA